MKYWWFLIILLLPCSCQAQTIYGSTQFYSPEEKSEALRFALASARHRAMRDIGLLLAEAPTVRIFARSIELNTARQTALAYAVSRQETATREVHDDVLSGQVSVLFTPGETDMEALREILLSPEQIEFYQVLAEAWDALFYQAPPPLQPGEIMARLQFLEALLMASTPFSPARDMTVDVPWGRDSALSHYLTGLRYLREGKAMLAKEEQDKALEERPGFALAHHARGAAYLALDLQALAVRDFDAAIRIFPGSARYHKARAAARLAERNYPGMCLDLTEACYLGDCADLDWALAGGLCHQ